MSPFDPNGLALSGAGQPMPQDMGMGMGMGAPGMMPDGGDDPAAPYVQTENPVIDHRRLIEWIDHPNIADDLPDDLKSKIGQRVVREREIDHGTLAEWRDRSTAAMDLAMQVAKGKTFPWAGSSNVVYPLMTTAAVQFNARSYPAIVAGRNVVKGVVVGPDNGIPQLGPDGSPLVQMMPGPQGPQPQIQWAQPPGAKRQRATRIGEHMSWQLLTEMKEWEEETDKLLLILPIIGCVFRKSYFNPTWATNVSTLVMPQNVVINYWAKSLERAPRISEDLKFYPNEIEENVRAGLWTEHDYGMAEGGGDDKEAPHEFIEQHCLLDLDDDGYKEPYVVTVHKTSQKVARIAARYDADGVHVNRQHQVAKIDPIHYYTKYDFLPSFDNGIYGTGFGQILGPINAGINTALNQMFDAATLQNTGGGFVGRGLSMQGGSLKFKMGEYKVVNVPGQTVRDSIVNMQWPGPSPVLFQLLGLLVEAGKDVASVKDALTGETAAATMQPTTLMALIEQGLKVFTAIYKRIHRSAKDEYAKLFALNKKFLEHQARYQVGDEWKTVTKEDYSRSAGVEPISDPAMVSDAMRAAKAQFLGGFANDPMMDGKEIRRRILDAGQIEDADKLFAPQPPPNPVMVAKAAELKLEGRRVEAEIASRKATQIRDISQAVLNLANADKAVGDQHLNWIEQHIDILRLNLEALTKPAGKADGGDPGGLPEGPEGMPQTNHPDMPNHPGDLMMPWSDAAAAPDGSMAPPFPGARVSASGNWYPGHPAGLAPAGR